MKILNNKNKLKWELYLLIGLCVVSIICFINLGFNYNFLSASGFNATVILVLLDTKEKSSIEELGECYYKILIIFLNFVSAVYYITFVAHIIFIISGLVEVFEVISKTLILSGIVITIFTVFVNLTFAKDNK